MPDFLTPFQPYLQKLDQQQPSMLQQTIMLANINSGSFNARGVNRVLETLQPWFASLGGEHEVIPVAPFEIINDLGKTEKKELGNALRIKKRPNAPLQLFLCGHLDTVFAVDSDFQEVREIDEDTINGPGVTDLKGGLIVMLRALEVLESSPWAKHVGWEVLLNPDEEIGSPGSASLIKEAAQRVHVGMIYEPGFPDGSLAGQRKGSGNFTVICHGKAAHAGREHHLGRNAIRSLCDFVSRMDSLNGQREGVTFNPGYIHGGGPTNIVPDCCVNRFNIRIGAPEDESWCLQELQRIINEINGRQGIRLELHGGFGRKPKVLTAANKQLLSLVRECGNALGMTIDVKPTGGCCDGNNLAAAGIPNIDTLGVQGGFIHSNQEYMKISSLVERAKLSATLLMSLAKSEVEGQGNQWLKEK